MFGPETLDKLEALNKRRTAGPWMTRKHMIHDHARWGDLYEIHVRERAVTEAAAGERGKNYTVFGPDEEGVGDSPIIQCCDNGNEEADSEFISAAANSMAELIRLARIGAQAEACPKQDRSPEDV